MNCAQPLTCWLPSALTVVGLTNCTSSSGRYSSEVAKMTGMTPAWFTFSGR